MNLSRLLMFFIVLISLSSAVALLTPSSQFATNEISNSHIQTRIALRDLWVEHIFWTRNWVVATLHNDIQRAHAADGQVINNAQELSRNLAAFYGQSATDRIIELLVDHWKGIKSYYKATTDNDLSSQEKVAKLIMHNADNTAILLNKLYPQLSHSALKSFLHQHNAHHMEQIVQLRTSMYAQETKTWHAMRHEMHALADSIADSQRRQPPRTRNGQ